MSRPTLLLQLTVEEAIALATIVDAGWESLTVGDEAGLYLGDRMGDAQRVRMRLAHLAASAYRARAGEIDAPLVVIQ
jgi:hypothetical protein